MNRYIVFLMMSLICFVQISCKSHTTESLNAEGEVLLKQGNYNGAVVHFKNALEKDPNFVEARFNLALAYVETGKLDQAEREFQKVQLQNPRDARVTFQLARVANFQNQPAVAVPLLDAYLKEHPNDAAAIEQLAFAATTSGDMASAREHLEKVLAIEPDRISAKLALIHNFMVQGDRGNARQAIDALLAKEPKNRLALHALAQLEAQERDPEGMLDVYTRISSIDPSDLFARYKEGSLLIEKGEGDSVRASAEAMIKQFPNKAEGYRLLGLYHSRMGNFDEAVTQLAKSLRIQPDLETYYLLGLAYFHQGNLEMAVTQFQTVLDYAPGFIQARIMLGEIFLRQGRGAEAMIVADKMLETSPDDFRGHALKGDALMLTGKPQESLAQYGRARELSPTHYGLMLKNGLLKLSLGQADGEQDLLEAVRVSPQGLDARLALHAFYLRNGRGDEALKVLNDGLTGSKPDAVLYNALAKAALGRKDAEGADDYLTKARAADPSFLQTYYNLATFRLVQGKPDDAVAQYDLALGVKPDDVRALTASAAVLDKQGKVDAARSRLERARATGDLGASLTLSAFLQQHGQSDAALKVLEEEQTKSPANLALVQAKARLHVARKEVDKAMALYGQLEAADPWAGTMERTRAWMALGEMDKAEESARGLIQLSPNKAQSYLPLAGILEARKDRTGAEAELRKAMEKEPGNAQAAVLLGEFLMRGRELDKADKVFDVVLASVPTNAQALTGKGMIVQFRGDKAAAARLYLQAVQARHDHVPALNNLAMLWADSEETRLQALDLAMAAFVRANSNPSVIDTLGYALIRNDRSEEALKVLDRALALAPGHPTILYHQAMALAALDRTSEALTTLEQSLAGGEFEERAEAKKLFEELRKK